MHHSFELFLLAPFFEREKRKTDCNVKRAFISFSSNTIKGAGLVELCFKPDPQDIFVGRILVISSSGSMIRQERNDKISAGRMV